MGGPKGVRRGLPPPPGMTLLWDYANAWSSPAYLRSLDRAGVAGPVFISVAPRETAAEKMNKFLDINPMVPRERLFVDDSPTSCGRRASRSSTRRASRSRTCRDRARVI